MASHRKRDRFPPELLKKYLKEFGVDPFSDLAYVDSEGLVQGALVEKVGNLPKTLKFFSLAEIKRDNGLE